MLAPPQPSEYSDLVSSLFKLYSARLEQIIARVKQHPQSATREQVITQDLKAFKQKLATTCQFYVNDIWENFQTYATQQKTKASRDRFTKIMNIDLRNTGRNRTPTRSLSNKPSSTARQQRMATPTRASMLSFQPVATRSRDGSNLSSARKTSRTPPPRRKAPTLTTRTDLFTHLLDKCESRAFSRLQQNTSTHSPTPTKRPQHNSSTL
jgi:hypothetical protein